MTETKEAEAPVPVYRFEEEGTESPIHRQISKTLEVTETFKLYDVFSYMARLNKAISDKEAEIEGLKTMREAYEKELVEIESQLGVQELEAEYQKEIAENINNQVDSAVESALKEGK